MTTDTLPLSGEELVKQIQESLSETIGTRVKDLEDAHGSDREKLHAEIATLEARLEATEKAMAEQAKNRLPGVEVVDPEIHKSEQQMKDKFSFFRGLKLQVAQANPGRPLDISDCGYEQEVFRETAARISKTAQNVATDSAGGAAVPVEVSSTLIPELRENSIAMQSGIQSFTGLAGNMSFVRDEGGIDGAYLDTEAEETGSEETTSLSVVSANPKPLAAFVPLTWLAMRQPTFSMETFVRGKLAKSLALLKDLKTFKGEGADGEPLGIFNTGGLGEVDWSTITNFSGSSQESSEYLRKHRQKLRKANALNGARKLAWIMEPDVVEKFENVLDGDGRPLFLTADDAGIERLQRVPIYDSNQLDQDDTDSFLLYGDMNQAADLEWGTLELAASPETEENFRKGRVTVRGIMAHDIVVFQPTAFAKATGLDIS